jgi:hypothetical protein
MSPRVIGLIAGVVVAMAITLALPPHDLGVLIFGTLALVAVLCAIGWMIGGRLERDIEDDGHADPEAEPAKPPARHIFVGAGAAILVIVLFAVPVASSSSVLGAFALLGAAVVAGVCAGAFARRWQSNDSDASD